MAKKTEEKQVPLKGLGTAGLVLGIIGMVLSFIPIINNVAFFLGVLAIIFAIVCIIKKNRCGVVIAALILGVASIGVTLIMQKAASDALQKVTDEATQSMDNATGKNTDEILDRDVSVTIGAYEATKNQYGIANTKLNLTIKNLLTEAKSYSITIEALNANNERIATDTIYVNRLGAGASQVETAFKYVASDVYDAMKTATFRVATVSEY